ncbi:uncharacterized protein BP5553_07071 [Venustampulla echinocandica]|uniref:Uncharacterized protein n=1 Tax=Venustampulla echinocandica TaxID=2656787 RepID=A0A370TIH5_9HELO|nr:uncharacterized protein BP5553_07071 [Venustampulla echinocandica]RDL35140.1 hypothetical protein BP5553_07071 [Venustampulla echinocandica]
MSAESHTPQALASSLEVIADRVPNEVWCLILNYSSQKEHAAFSLVSRLLRRLAEPFLYSEFSWVPPPRQELPPIPDLSGKDILAFTKSRRKKRNRVLGHFGPPPYLLLRTILNRPDLAHHVKRATILAVDTSAGLFWNKYETREGGLSLGEFTMCVDRIQEMEDIPYLPWVHALKEGALDVAIGLLVAFLPRLTLIDIRIRGSCIYRSKIFQAIGDPAKLYRLQPIKNIVVSLDTDNARSPQLQRDYFEQMLDNQYDIDLQMSRLFRVPGLQTLSVSCFVPDVVVWDWRSGIPYTENLTALSLRYSELSEDHLAQLLEATPKLETLECDLVYDRSLGEHCDGGKINSALSLASDTLKHLTLRFQIIYPFDIGNGNDPWNVRQSIGSMKHFTQLKYLAIPILVLYNRAFPQEFDTILPNQLEIIRPDWYPAIPDPREHFAPGWMLLRLYMKRRGLGR